MKKTYVYPIDVLRTGKDINVLNFLHQLTTSKPVHPPPTKTIRVHVCSATYPTAFPRGLKITPTVLPKMGGDASTAFPASLLSASANLFNHFFKTPSFFGGKPPVPPPPPKTTVIAMTIVEIVIERVVNFENMVMPCSLNNVRILSVNDVS